MTYGNITEIKDSNDEIHDQYEVITGHGDRNSNLKVTVSYFAELDEDYHYDITDAIKYGIHFDITGEGDGISIFSQQ